METSQLQPLQLQMPKFEWDEVENLRVAGNAKLERMMLSSAGGNPHGIGVAMVLNMLDRAPASNSPWSTWHKSVAPTLEAKATAWYNAQPADQKKAPTLHGQALFDYYLQLLAERFEPERKAYHLEQFRKLKMGKQSPTSWLQQLRACEPFLKGSVPEDEFVDRFLRGLPSSIRHKIDAQYGCKALGEQYQLLNNMAADAQTAWQNARTLAVRSGDTGQQGQDGEKKKTFHCDVHGPFSTHPTSKCKSLGNGRTAAATAETSTGESAILRRMEQMEAELARLRAAASTSAAAASSSAPASAPRTKYEADKAKKKGPSGKGGGDSSKGREGRRQAPLPRCGYCGAGHDEDRCYVKHPDLAPEGFEPRSVVHKKQFLENKAKLEASRPRKAAAAAAQEEEEEDEEDGYASFCSHAAAATGAGDSDSTTSASASASASVSDSDSALQAVIDAVLRDPSAEHMQALARELSASASPRTVRVNGSEVLIMRTADQSGVRYKERYANLLCDPPVKALPPYVHNVGQAASVAQGQADMAAACMRADELLQRANRMSNPVLDSYRHRYLTRQHWLPPSEPPDALKDGADSAAATMLSQPTPVSFTPSPIPVMPLAPAPRPPRPQPQTA
ncbi:hypothetical protein HYH02_015386 [Chlamydomonas schloesseri]|uniref:Uncharacterized protein n=1 Tax=Chlamydomonas schloesseri TaxID=2026947 RepID=A0A835S9L7_9CHLO|nr:hypothetical protein HYH02_015386 [Chlamydomonas schloesseri]|eukprot:KAG2422859.1 hypothetical protein HYH02_015386 [Chlamydomonas schloesseri]